MFEDPAPIPQVPARLPRRRRRISVVRPKFKGNSFRVEGDFLVNELGQKVQNLKTQEMLLIEEKKPIVKTTPQVPLYRRKPRKPGVYLEDLQKRR